MNAPAVAAALRALAAAIEAEPAPRVVYVGPRVDELRAEVRRTLKRQPKRRKSTECAEKQEE